MTLHFTRFGHFGGSRHAESHTGFCFSLCLKGGPFSALTSRRSALCARFTMLFFFSLFQLCQGVWLSRNRHPICPADTEELFTGSCDFLGESQYGVSSAATEKQLTTVANVISFMTREGKKSFIKVYSDVIIVILSKQQASLLFYIF